MEKSSVAADNPPGRPAPRHAHRAGTQTVLRRVEDTAIGSVAGPPAWFSPEAKAKDGTLVGVVEDALPS
jgi:hypothetical protein